MFKILRASLRVAVAAGLTSLVIPLQAVATPQFTTLHAFDGARGFGPMAGVVVGADNALYGTTSQGGAAAFGTVFRFDLQTAGFGTLHDFDGADGSLLYSGVMLGSDGMIYGSTYSGGTAGLGTLFRVGSDGQGFLSLYSFGGDDGAKPDDLTLTQSADGAYCGTTSESGPDGGGTLFRFDAGSGDLSTVHAFAGAGGVDAGVVAGHDGYWYGTTYTGGAHGAGSVYRVDPTTWEVTTLHDFSGPDGQNPVPGALTQGADGLLYGTTQLGGGSYGSVYQLDPDTRDFHTLHAFSGINDGRNPLGGVTLAADGYLYGTTVLGGAGYGTVYRVDPSTLAYGIVVWFAGSNGRSPSGNLLYRNGALYGVTRLGGNFNSGTLYELALDTDSDNVLDREDNCTLIANTDQRDSNGDGFGNACDPDLDNDGVVNFVDLGLLKTVFFTTDADADFDGDGAVNFIDLGTLKGYFFQAPGPSGLAQ